MAGKIGSRSARTLVMTWHTGILGQRLLRALKSSGKILSANGFQLGGGTAIAAYLGHRHSMDLDWFVPRFPSSPEILLADLMDQGLALANPILARGTINATLGGVRISLLEYPYPPLGPLAPWPEMGCALLSLDDLATMKLVAVTQRGDKKDLIDIHALVTNHASLAQMLHLYQTRYGLADISPVLLGLTHFLDADLQRTPTLQMDADWRQIKQDLVRWVGELG